MSETATAYDGRPVYIVDGSRTPFLKASGKPGPFTAADLAVAAGRPLLARQPFAASSLDEVVLGCVMPRSDEANIGRVAALRLGCGERVPAWTVQRNCASGLNSLDAAARRISDGVADLVLAGGSEAMSHAPVMWDEGMVGWLTEWMRAKGVAGKARALGRLRPGHLKPVIGLLRGLTDPVVGLSMGQTAENLAHRFGIERAAMDAFAEDSHRRLAAALDAGRLTEVAPLFARDGSHFDADTGLRRDTDAEQLGRLRPAFDKPFGDVTAGNSAQVTDGAAWMLLASEDAVARWDLPVLGRIRDTQWAGVDPAQMGLGPIHAMTPLMQRQGLSIDDVGYYEINEAFAAQVLACLEAWDDAGYCRDELGLEAAMGRLDRDRLNVDGGAVSIGHPVGTSGTRIALRLVHTLRDHGARRGLASLCIGGGQGGAMLIENAAA
jgi:acetyl-CoA C-acetyltransferase